MDKSPPWNEKKLSESKQRREGVREKEIKGKE